MIQCRTYLKLSLVNENQIYAVYFYFSWIVCVCVLHHHHPVVSWGRFIRMCVHHK